MNSGRCFRLNRVGAEVWSMLQASCSLAEVCSEIASKYKLPRDQVDREIGALIDDLTREDLARPARGRQATVTRFSERYAVEVLADGGIAVDLTTGGYVRLNRPAALICAAMTTCETIEADALRRPRSQHLRSQCSIDNRRRRARPRGPCTQARTDRSLSVSAVGTKRRLLPFVQRRAEITALPRPANPFVCRTPVSAELGAEVFEYLRTVAPKLLYLRGATVLHGSACWTRATLRGFCGDSGAGKTTTARAFGRTGNALFAEDMLVLASIFPIAVPCWRRGAINSWATQGAARLTEAVPGSEFSTDGLMAAFTGAAATVGEIWFIEAARRSHEISRIELQRLAPTEGALALVGSLFLGSITPSDWRRFLATAAAIGATLPLFAAVMPAGLDRLETAVRRYTENSAS